MCSNAACLTALSPAQAVRKQAFTLIEVLVVVAIIALLIAILIPALSEARDQARSAKCLANMQDNGTGVHTFAGSHRGRFQIMGNVTTTADLSKISDSDMTTFAYESGTGASPPNLLGWPAVLAREASAGHGVKKNADWGIPGVFDAFAKKSSIRRFESLSCPADHVELNTFPAPVSPTPPPGGGQPWYWGYLSYGVNTDVIGTGKGGMNPPGEAGRGIWREGNIATGQGISGSAKSGDELRGRLDKVIRPAEVMMFVDAGCGDKNSAITTMAQPGAPTNIGSGGPNTAQNVHGPLLEYPDRTYPIKLRHERHRRASLNLAFVDGHGAFVKRIQGNPANPNNNPVLMIPWWRYIPKVRVSPYNPGEYPIP